MINELFAGITILYCIISMPFLVISAMYEAGDDDVDFMAELGQK